MIRKFSFEGDPWGARRIQLSPARSPSMEQAVPAPVSGKVLQAKENLEKAIQDEHGLIENIDATISLIGEEATAQALDEARASVEKARAEYGEVAYEA